MVSLPVYPVYMIQFYNALGGESRPSVKVGFAWPWCFSTLPKCELNFSLWHIFFDSHHAAYWYHTVPQTHTCTHTLTSGYTATLHGIFCCCIFLFVLCWIQVFHENVLLALALHITLFYWLLSQVVAQ